MLLLLFADDDDDDPHITRSISTESAEMFLSVSDSDSHANPVAI